MLNISQNPLNKEVDLTKYKSAAHVFHKRYYRYFTRFLTGFALVAFVMLFLPWTQNITGRGEVTTLTPDQRPQTIQSPIPGRIEKWFVREGDYVKKGDTIMQIAEVKSEYFDPNLVQRTEQQRTAKEFAVKSYNEKVNAQDRQIKALQQERELKLQQARNKLQQARYKVQMDSIDVETAEINIGIAQTRYLRTLDLQDSGYVAVKELEESKLKLQETERKLVSTKNKLLASKNEVLNAQYEISRVNAEYSDKISKAESEKYSALSSQMDSEAQVTKLENEVSNYSIRNALLFITATQNGSLIL
jgi:adhesin transport system membrane fusion protein